MAYKPRFSDKEIRDWVKSWIRHFGHLDELVTLRHVVQDVDARLREIRDVLDNRLESIAIMLGGPRR